MRGLGDPGLGGVPRGTWVSLVLAVQGAVARGTLKQSGLGSLGTAEIEPERARAVQGLEDQGLGTVPNKFGQH